MRLCVKKVYCPYCQRLVGCRAEKNDKKVRILCGREGHLLYIWNGVTWERVGEAT